MLAFVTQPSHASNCAEKQADVCTGSGSSCYLCVRESNVSTPMSQCVTWECGDTSAQGLREAAQQWDCDRVEPPRYPSCVASPEPIFAFVIGGMALCCCLCAALLYTARTRRQVESMSDEESELDFV